MQARLLQGRLKQALLRSRLPAVCVRCSSSSTASIPLVVLRALAASKQMKLAQFPGAGRGLQTKESIPYGTELFREVPMLAIPSFSHAEQVCYHCLAMLGPTKEQHAAAKKWFCCKQCMQAAHASYLAAEAEADLSQFQQLCQAQGERFPLLAARLALMHITKAVHDELGPHASSPPQQQHEQQPQQQRPLQGDALQDMSFLCFANILPPGPPPWLEAYATLKPALSQAITGMIARSRRRGTEQQQQVSSSSSGAPDQTATSSDAESHTSTPSQPVNPPIPHGLSEQEQGLHDRILASIDQQFYVGVLARLHLNVFRIDTVVLPAFGGSQGPSLAELAAAAVRSEEGEGSSFSAKESEEELEEGDEGAAALAQLMAMQQQPQLPLSGGSTGSGAFVAASLFNHSCEPNVNVVFPSNDSTAAFYAARDIDAGEQLHISYLDGNASLAARQQHLQFAYGFKCQCVLCVEQSGSVLTS